MNIHNEKWENFLQQKAFGGEGGPEMMDLNDLWIFGNFPDRFGGNKDLESSKNQDL